MTDKRKIVKRHFRILVDYPAVREFMIRVFQLNWHNGVPAPFFEYALSADWADQTFAHRDAIWEDDGKIVAFCFYESRPGAAFFNLDPAYGFLAPDMLDHAEKQLCGDDGKLKLNLFGGQDALIAAAEKRGYTPDYSYDDKLFNLAHPLN